jgi:drug/metabolite transporter (DMT)-like permease
MLVSASGYATFTLFTRVALETLGATDIVLWRFAIAVPIAWAIVVVRRVTGRGPSPLAVRWRQSIGMGLLFGVLAWLAFAALEHLSGSLYVVIIYTYPAMVAIGAHLLGRPSPGRIAAPLVVMMAGIALTAPEVFSSPGSGVVLGAVMTIANAALYATYILWSESVVGDESTHPVDGMTSAAWGLTGSLATAIVIVAITGDLAVPSDARAVLAMGGLATFATVIAGSAFLLGVARVGPARAALLATLEPVLALVLLGTIGGESLGGLQAVGAVLVLTAVVWSQRLRTT